MGGVGRARVLAGRIASPVDEASIPPGIIRPARSRAVPCGEPMRWNGRCVCVSVGPASSRAVSLRLSMKPRYLQVSYGPPGVGPYRGPIPHKPPTGSATPPAQAPSLVCQLDRTLPRTHHRYRSVAQRFYSESVSRVCTSSTRQLAQPLMDSW